MKTDAHSTSRWSYCDQADAGCNPRAVRQLLSFLVANGFACATRARIAGATAELLENVARHAYPDGEGDFRIQATLTGPRLLIEVSDDGVGFEVANVMNGALDDRRDCGLGRARALAEGMRLTSEQDRGSTVELEFIASSAMFADDRGLDLSDLDYIDPALTRRVLSALRDGSLEPQFHFSPALAVCVGRLLSPPRVDAGPLAELWS